MRFERMADDDANARPPYPQVRFDKLTARRVIGPGIRVLEVGAGAAVATRTLVSSGSDVVALEPGRRLATYCEGTCPASRW